MAAEVVCTGCGGSAVPEGRDYSGLWDSGWRWLATLGLFSCPGCPPVVLVDGEGRHLRPGTP